MPPNKKGSSNGKVVIATVKGDVHDIGKKHRERGNAM